MQPDSGRVESSASPGTPIDGPRKLLYDAVRGKRGASRDSFGLGLRGRGIAGSYPSHS
jgi:hypothetical protein